MREPTDRELYLQNLLATSAVLVYRSAKAMAAGSYQEQQLLVIECNQWFSEVKSSLSAEIRSAESRRVIPTPAPPAESNGVAWKRGGTATGLTPPGLVKTTETNSTEGGASSTESLGLTSPPSEASLTPSQLAAMTFFGMKP